MKKLFILALGLLCSFSLMACSGDTAEDSILEEDMLEEELLLEEETVVESAVNPVGEGYGSYESVDVDLPSLSATMTYAEVYNMMVYPDDYIGKTVKMYGIYGEYFEESTGITYHAIVIMDATACCAQGLEFVLAAEDAVYPDDYPVVGEYATVVGVFDTYVPPEAPDALYCHLEEAEFIY